MHIVEVTRSTQHTMYQENAVELIMGSCNMYIVLECWRVDEIHWVHWDIPVRVIGDVISLCDFDSTHWRSWGCVISGESAVAGKPADGRGSGWNDPPSSCYSSSPRVSLPRKRVPYPLQTNCTPSRQLITELSYIRVMIFVKTLCLYVWSVPCELDN